jgi:O-acetyl-ADP-ribose deacetylase (regulator of RNase III)
MSAIELYLGDITTLDVDCIVNAANESLLGGGGVDGAIHRVAGPELLEECITLNDCQVGQAKITKGYNLKAKYVIHTVGPIYTGDRQDDIDLANCYKNCLELVKKNNIKSIAFPAISTGAYGKTKKKASQIAIETCKSWLANNYDLLTDLHIIYVCYDEKTYKIYDDLI